MPKVTAARESVLYRPANTLLDSRRTGVPLKDLPEEQRPVSEEESFFVQDVMMKAYGDIGGWKIGARGPEAVPFFAPMPLYTVGENGSLFRGPLHRLHGAEAEIAFRIGRDLPPIGTPYSRDEVVAAIGSCHPAIEIIESAFVQPLEVPREWMFADMQMHGGFVAGPPITNWQQIDWAKERVTLLVDGSVRVENEGSNPGGTDLVRLLVYLANEGAKRTGGLKEGQFVTTGSWTGVTWATAGASVIAKFEHAGEAALTFASAHRD